MAAAELDRVGGRVIVWETRDATGKLVRRELVIRRRAQVAVANQKGGVAKTATALNTAAAAAANGVETLAIDLDPQANLSSGLGVDPDDAPGTMYEVLHPTPSERVSIDEAAVQVRPHLRLVPGHLSLASIEENGNGPGGELLLSRALAKTSADLIIVDCPPNLGRLTVASLVECDWVLVPVKCGPYELDGFANLLDTIERVKANGLADRLAVGFVVATMYHSGWRIDRDVADYLKAHFPNEYVERPIRASVRVAEATSAHVPVREFTTDPIATDLDELARVVVEGALT